MRFVVGISGASGTILAKRLIEALPHPIDLIITQEGAHTAQLELQLARRTPQAFYTSLSIAARERVTLHSNSNLGATVASGSHRTSGMIIIPCSMATVAAIAVGLGDNLLRRAADVTLKECRPLILVPRETPLSSIHLENLLKLSRIGVHIIPPMPAWYQHPTSMEDVENGIVAKILDILGMSHRLSQPWKGTSLPQEVPVDAHTTRLESAKAPLTTINMNQLVSNPYNA